MQSKLDETVQEQERRAKMSAEREESMRRHMMEAMEQMERQNRERENMLVQQMQR